MVTITNVRKNVILVVNNYEIIILAVKKKLEFFSKILVEIVYLRSTVEKGFNSAIQKFCRWKMWLLPEEKKVP